MKTLSCDLETYSCEDLRKCGVYRYCEAPDFEILLFAYSVDGGEVQLADLASGEKLPGEIINALTDDTVIKWAWHANFERVCLSRYLRDLGIINGFLNPEGWRCDMVWAATLGLPFSLEGAGAVLGLDKQKLTEGKELVRYFCKPCSPTQANGGRTRNLPIHAPDKWEMFKRYNIRDVEAEMGIQQRLSKFPVPNELISAMREFTKLENPNSVQQMKDWLACNGLETESLNKKAVAELMKNAPPELIRVLTLRQQLAKSSVKKYQTMQNAVCADGRARGLFSFYGANRTGRFSSKIIQLQNLARNSMSDLDQARALVKTGDYESLSMLYNDVPDTLSQLVRTAFVPPEGKLFYVADFSAIEARVIAWFAGEKWRSEVFRKGGDIYCASASQMFKVPVEKHGVNGHLRQKGKIAELALGYGGGTGALTAMGALEMGLKEEELQPLVNAWRNANPNIVKFWWAVDNAVMEAVSKRTTTKTHGLTFSFKSGMLFITLPSGRKLAYVKPRIGMNQFSGESITYEGIGAAKKWERLESYGPKFVENIVQGTARDILCYAMKTLRHCSIVMHIHDEVVIEADPRVSLDALCEQMGRTPPWAEGLILTASGYTSSYYKKD